MALSRVTTFVPATVIQSSQMNAELDQLVEALNGTDAVDIIMKYSHASNPVLTVNQQSTGVIQRWQNNGTTLAELSGTGRLSYPAGVGSTPSTDLSNPLGTYATQVVQATGANTTETDFFNKTTSANVLAQNGDCLIGISVWITAANANTKRIRAYWGATTIYDSTAVALNNSIITFMHIFNRESATVGRSTVSIISQLNATLTTQQNTDLGSANFATTNVLRWTATNGTASANDIVLRYLAYFKGSV